MSHKDVPSGNRDAFAGIFFIFCGVFFAIYSSAYRMGTILQMGPGFFPLVLAVLLVILGLIIFAKAVIVKNIERIPFALRPALTISLAVVVFAFAVDRMGLLISVSALVMLSGLAMQPYRTGRMVALAVALALVCVVLFVFFLSLPFRVLPNLGN